MYYAIKITLGSQRPRVCLSHKIIQFEDNILITNN